MLLFMFDGMNSRKQGDVGLGSAIAYFTRMGHTVSIPLTDNQQYDLITDDGSGPQRVQVKTTGRQRTAKSYVVTLKVSGGNRSSTGKVKRFDSSVVDLLFVLCNDGTLYLLPAEPFHNMGEFCLSDKWSSHRL